jgi:hypothetical protein
MGCWMRLSGMGYKPRRSKDSTRYILLSLTPWHQQQQTHPAATSTLTFVSAKPRHGRQVHMDRCTSHNFLNNSPRMLSGSVRRWLPLHCLQANCSTMQHNRAKQAAVLIRQPRGPVMLELADVARRSL